MDMEQTLEERPLLRGNPNESSGLSIVTATIVVVAGVFGSGIVTMPHCIALSGLWGILIYIVLAVTAGYCGINLSKCWQLVMELKPEYRGDVRNPYPVIACVCYGLTFSKVVSVLVNAINFSGALVMLLLGCQMFQLIKEFTNFSICEWILITGLCLMPFTWFGSPKHLWPIAIVSVMTGVTCASLILYSLDTGNIEMKTGVHPALSLESISAVFGTIFFMNSGASMFPTIQNDMKKKKHFVYVVALSYFVSSAFLLPIAFLTFKQITFEIDPNIISSFKTGVLKDIAFLSLAIHTFVAYVILINPVMQDCEELFRIPRSFCFKRVLIRTSLNLLAIFIGETLPKFNALLNLAGGSLVSLFTFIFPGIFYIRLSQLFGKQNPDSEQWKIKSLEKALLSVIIVFGTSAAVIVTFSATKVIVSEETFVLPCYVK